MLQYTGHCWEMARITTRFLNFNRDGFDAAFQANAAFIDNSCFSSQSSNLTFLTEAGRVLVNIMTSHHYQSFLCF